MDEREQHDASSDDAIAWHVVGRLEAIPRLGARVVCVPAGRIALFRDGADGVRALDDACPHRGGPLSEGIVHGDRVSCPLHGMCFSLESGRAIEPDEATVTTYPVRVVDGVVHLGLIADGRGSREDAA